MVTINTHEEFLTACLITLETRDREREGERGGGGVRKYYHRVQRPCVLKWKQNHCFQFSEMRGQCADNVVVKWGAVVGLKNKVVCGLHRERMRLCSRLLAHASLTP